MLVTCSVVLGPCLLAAPGVRSAGDYLVMSEDFEGGWSEDWHATDHNADSGLDYWGVTTYKKQDGSGSAWCAQAGTNSENFYSNSYNHYYDQDMQAVLQITLPGLSGYTTATLSFYYWAETGTTSLSDYLEVRAWNGWYWQHLWKQPEVDTDGSWDQITLELPLNTIWISFLFVSDDIVGLGPYEGAYVDTVRVYGYDETPPTSTMTDLDEYQSREMVYIIYTAVDRGGSGVSHVELYYRAHGTAAYEMYTTPDKVDGKWMEGVIPFNCSHAAGVGGYDFYTLAEDKTGNREVPATVPITSTIFDVLAPATEAATVSGPLPEDWTNSSVSVGLTASDDLSGVAVTRYRIDSEPWEDYDGAIDVSDEGEHVISYYSEDNAGNIEGVKSIGFALDSTAPNATLNTLSGGTAFANSTVAFVWESEDDLSGIDHCLFRVDDRAFEYLVDSEGIVEAVNLENGDHIATLRAYDSAGNFVETTFSFAVDQEVTDETETESDSDLLGWTVALAVLIIAIISVLMLLRMYRKEPAKHEGSDPAEPPDD